MVLVSKGFGQEAFCVYLRWHFFRGSFFEVVFFQGEFFSGIFRGVLFGAFFQGGEGEHSSVGIFRLAVIFGGLVLGDLFYRGQRAFFFVGHFFGRKIIYGVFLLALFVWAYFFGVIYWGAFIKELKMSRCLCIGF